ncbi:hypothetical protein MJO28_016288 [Puccinia striiformis f. sp. tritici]|uniref:Uncharacterized protein n=1 Tax=Puccinia striiformis f. sp. tritici TaxID=168172 RepID=A0ACC0DN03_9BASI|nr:hypothetical protein MJO28_016288 [Puccinia striiformis f. sp. tritici]
MILRVHVHGLFGFLALVSGGATGNAVTPTIRFNHELPPFEVIYKQPSRQSPPAGRLFYLKSSNHGIAGIRVFITFIEQIS